MIGKPRHNCNRPTKKAQYSIGRTNIMKLYKLNSNRWAMLSGETYIKGTLEEVRKVMEGTPFLVDPDAIDVALQEMAVTGDNIADFGIAGYFITTSKDAEAA